MVLKAMDSAPAIRRRAVQRFPLLLWGGDIRRSGNASFTVTQVFNSSGGEFFEAIPGAYTVNSDCTGTVTIEDFGLHFYIVTVGGGA
jgi:hypothetical protein